MCKLLPSAWDSRKHCQPRSPPRSDAPQHPRAGLSTRAGTSPDPNTSPCCSTTVCPHALANQHIGGWPVTNHKTGRNTVFPSVNAVLVFLHIVYAWGTRENERSKKPWQTERPKHDNSPHLLLNHTNSSGKWQYVFLTDWYLKWNTLSETNKCNYYYYACKLKSFL